MDSYFALIGTHQHGVAIQMTPERMPIQMDCTMPRSLYQFPYFVLSCAPKLTIATSRGLGEEEAQNVAMVSPTQNVDGQSQSKHSNSGFKLHSDTYIFSV